MKILIWNVLPAAEGGAAEPCHTDPTLQRECRPLSVFLAWLVGPQAGGVHWDWLFHSVKGLFSALGFIESTEINLSVEQRTIERAFFSTDYKLNDFQLGQRKLYHPSLRYFF